MTVTSGIKPLVGLLGVDAPELPIGVPFPVGLKVSMALDLTALPLSASLSDREFRGNDYSRGTPIGSVMLPGE